MTPFSGWFRSHMGNVNDFSITVTILQTTLLRMTLRGDLAGPKSNAPSNDVKNNPPLTISSASYAKNVFPYKK